MRLVFLFIKIIIAFIIELMNFLLKTKYTYASKSWCQIQYVMPSWRTIQHLWNVVLNTKSPRHHCVSRQPTHTRPETTTIAAPFDSRDIYNYLLTLSRVLQGRTGNFREIHFLKGLRDFFVNISIRALARVEILTKKVEKPREKVVFPKIFCSP